MQAQNVIYELLVKVLNDRAKKDKIGPNLVEALDGLSDLAVVTYGTAEAIGVDLDPFTDEVMRSNMDKVGGPIDEHGKMGKPPGWVDADIAGVLAKLEGYRLECERLEREPPKDVDKLTDDDWRTMTETQRSAYHSYWMSRGAMYFMCLGCSNPSAYGRACCPACLPPTEVSA